MSQRSRQRLQGWSELDEKMLDPIEPLEADLRSPMDAITFFRLSKADKQDYLMYLQTELGLDHIGIAEMLGIDRRRMYEIMAKLDVPLINSKNKGFNSPRQAQKLAEFRAKAKKPSLVESLVYERCPAFEGSSQEQSATVNEPETRKENDEMSKVTQGQTAEEMTEIRKRVIIAEFDDPVVELTLKIKARRKTANAEIKSLYDKELTGPMDIIDVEILKMVDI